MSHSASYFIIRKQFRLSIDLLIESINFYVKIIRNDSYFNITDSKKRHRSVTKTATNSFPLGLMPNLKTEKRLT